MPSFRIHRLRSHLRQQFRYGPHVRGAASVKPRDYEAGGSLEASSHYAAFFALRQAGTPLDVGDLLENPRGGLSIFKYVGFEDAQWAVPEGKPAGTPEAVDEMRS